MDAVKNVVDDLASVSCPVEILRCRLNGLIAAPPILECGVESRKRIVQREWHDQAVVAKGICRFADRWYRNNTNRTKRLLLWLPGSINLYALRPMRGRSVAGWRLCSPPSSNYLSRSRSAASSSGNTLEEDLLVSVRCRQVNELSNDCCDQETRSVAAIVRK